MSAPQNLGAMRPGNLCREGGENCALWVLIFLGSGGAAPRRIPRQLSGTRLCSQHSCGAWVSRLRAISISPSSVWSADERDSAWYRLHQAHPLGQEQPLRAPRGPVRRVSREAVDPAACLSEPPDPLQTTRKHRSAFATGTLSSSLSGPGAHGPPPPPPVTASSPATRTCDRAHR